MIRLANADDAPQIAAIYRPFCLESCISFETEAPDAAEMAARIDRINRRYAWLVDDVGGVVRGYAYASPHRERAAYRWAVEVTVYVHERRQGLYKAYAGILVPNPRSQAFHESMGFTLVGIYRKIGYKHGAWRDVGWWELALQPEAEAPAEPGPPAHLTEAEL